MLSRFLKAAKATIFGQLIGRFGSFLLLPLFLSRWTPAVYGEWLTLYAAVGYLASLDVGMQAAALNRLTAAYARHDFADYRRAQNSAFAIYSGTAAIGLALLLTVALTMPVGRWLGLKQTSTSDASVVLILLGAYVLWSMPSKIVIGAYQTTGNLAKSQWISNGTILLNLAATAVLLFFHQGMKALATLPLLTSFVVVALVIGKLRHSDPEIAPGIRSANWQTIRSLMRPSLMFAVMIASMLLHYQALMMVVSVALGGAIVAVFAVSRTLTSVLRTATDTIMASVTPDVCRLDALGDSKQLQQVLRFVAGASVCIGIAGAATIWWEGASVITLWTRGRLVPDVPLLRLLALVAIGQSAWVGLGVYGSATNRNRTIGICYIVSNTIALVVAIALIHRLGASAVPIGLLAGEGLACYYFVIKDACNHCSVRPVAFALKLWTFVAITSALALVSTYWVHQMIPTGAVVLRWFAVGLASTIVASASTWLLWFPKDQRDIVKSRLATMLAGQAGFNRMPQAGNSEYD